MTAQPIKVVHVAHDTADVYILRAVSFGFDPDEEYAGTIYGAVDGEEFWPRVIFANGSDLYLDRETELETAAFAVRDAYLERIAQ